jgi:predicted DNA-binding protein
LESIKIYVDIIRYIRMRGYEMKQLLIKLPDEEYMALEEYCQRTGRTKSAVIRYQISKLSGGDGSNLLTRKIERIQPGKGKLLSELIREMRG